MEVSRPNIDKEKIVEFPLDDRFIKLPFENVLKVHNITPIHPQIALSNAINDPTYRFVVAALSRRTGKTFISNLIAHAITLIPGSSILIMAPNYSLAQISWDIQRKIVKDFGIEVAKANSKDRILELENGSMVRMGSISQVDSVVGRSYDLILFDECALNNDGQDAFNVQLRPTMDKPNSKAIFISTPRGHNWFYDFYQRGWSDDPKWKRWASIKSTVEDNPRASLEDVQDARQGLSKAEFEQEYYCSFNAMQGLVWEFNRDNIIKIDNIDPSWEVICGLDVGFRDHTALVVAMTDGQNVYIVDEYFSAEKATSIHAIKIKELIEKYDADFVFIDHSAAQTKADLAYDYDISCANANKSKLDGIGYVSSLIDWDRVFVDPKCVHVIDSLNNYRWDLRPNKVKEDTVHDEFSHMADAIRYAIYSYAPNMEGIGGIRD
jgi:phage terminase large subunit